MAGRVTNRKALREAYDAAEARGVEGEEVVAETKKKKEPAKRTRAKKEPAEVRVKVQWAVFSQNLKRVATFRLQPRSHGPQEGRRIVPIQWQ
jgi:hypothetical protein